MMKNNMVIKNMNIDYNFLGAPPDDLENNKKEEIINKFMDCFKFTFSNTVLSYYGNFNDIKNDIIDNLILDELDFNNLEPKKQWYALILTVIKLFYQMHNTLLANETVDIIIDNFNNFSFEELNLIINDLNFSLYFAIDECIVISPSKINYLKATADDCFLLNELLENRKQIIESIETLIKENDIREKDYEDNLKEEIDSNLYINLYDLFMLTWIDLMEEPEEKITDRNDWDNLLAEIYSVTITCFALFIISEEKLIKLSDRIYNLIANIVKDKYNIKFPIPKINLI